ncbi:MAG: hypothetical protein WBG18_19455 [Xanthobacteraceae bacterium]
MGKKPETTAEAQLGPTAEPYEVGLSANVLRELPNTVHPSIAAKIRDHLARKG